MPTHLRTLLLHPTLLKVSLFTSYQEVPIPFKSLLTTSLHPDHGRPAFRLALDGWPEA